MIYKEIHEKINFTGVVAKLSNFIENELYYEEGRFWMYAPSEVQDQTLLIHSLICLFSGHERMVFGVPQVIRTAKPKIVNNCAVREQV